MTVVISEAGYKIVQEGKSGFYVEAKSPSKEELNEEEAKEKAMRLATANGFNPEGESSVDNPPTETEDGYWKKGFWFYQRK